jgi:hypothetical protein
MDHMLHADWFAVGLLQMSMSSCVGTGEGSRVRDLGDREGRWADRENGVRRL